MKPQPPHFPTQSRPRLKPTVEMFTAQTGAIYLMPSGGDDDFVLESPTSVERTLLTSLDGQRCAEQLASDLSTEFGGTSRDDVLQMIWNLAASGLIEDASPSPTTLSGQDLERLDRQLAYLREVAPYGTPATRYQEAISSSRVAVLGAGGVGSCALLMLASIGVQHLRVVDGDVVEMSNLNRQVLYTEADVGQYKVSIAALRLRDYSSAIEVEAIPTMLTSCDAVADAVADADFVIEAADTPPHVFSRWLNHACLDRGIPHLSMGCFPPYVRVGPLYVPGRTGCRACREDMARLEHPHYDDLVAHRQGEMSVAATLGPACMLGASILASDVFYFLTDIAQPATWGRTVTIDLRTLGVEREELVANPTCPECRSD